MEVRFKSYSPFGELLTGKQSGFGYNGESYDAATGALYLRARYYEPALNCFSQKDIDRGTVTNPKSLNRYLYTWNNPVSNVIAYVVQPNAGANVGREVKNMIFMVGKHEIRGTFYYDTHTECFYQIEYKPPIQELYVPRFLGVIGLLALFVAIYGLGNDFHTWV